MSFERADDLQEIFLQDCNFRNLSRATIRDYDHFLTAIKNRFGSLANVTRQDIKELVLEKLNEGQSPATVNHYIRAIKAFHSFLHREEYTDSNKMAGLSLITMPEKLKPILEPEQISRMIAKIPSDRFFNVRDKSMIMLLWDAALRLNELLHIKVSDLDFRLGTVKITGKGRKDRVVPFGQKTRRELVKYLKIRGYNLHRLSLNSYNPNPGPILQSVENAKIVIFDYYLLYLQRIGSLKPQIYEPSIITIGYYDRY